MTPTQLIPSLVVIVAVLVLAAWPGGQRAEVSFYETTAQIFPVLLVGLAVEDRLQGFSEALSPAYRWQIVLAVVVGEFVSVLAVSGAVASYDNGQRIVGPNPTVSDLMSWLTVARLGVGFLTLIIVALR